jgi:single-stranded DNA-binding protein
MDTVGINKVLGLGRVGKYGVSVQQSPHGTDCARFLLAVPERGHDGQLYTTRLPIEIWGKKASEATTLSAGQLVLVEGRLGKRRTMDDTAWELIVKGFEAVPVLPAAKGGDPRQPSLF